MLIEAVRALAARIDRLEPYARRAADAVNSLQGAPIRMEIELR